MPLPVLSIMEEPNCLIETGSDGKIVVNSKVLEELKSIDGHVVVISIAGPYRTGKSFLMNKLYGENNGFPLGSTVQSQTKGIWIWARAHPRKKDSYLVFLDTEGLGDVEKEDEERDNQILVLAILLASTFVYNVMGVIGNDAIQKLHFIAELAKNIQIRTIDSEGKPVSKGDDSDFDFYFPDFVYSLRDFMLKLEIDGNMVTPDEYLEHTLATKKGNRPEVRNFNNIRLCIRKYFKNRKCFTFMYPFLRRCDLDNVSNDELQPEFLQEIEAFVNYIHRRAPVKQISGRKLTGRMFGSLVEAYIEQLRNGIPCIENAVDKMAHEENTRTKQEAVELYYHLMLKSLTMPVLDDADFSRCHGDSLAKAIDLFLSKAVFDRNNLFQKQMNEEIGKRYQELVAMNEDISRSGSQEALKTLYEPIRRKVANGNYTKSGGFELYKNDMKKLEEDYLQQPGRQATKMRHLLLEFLHSRRTEEYLILKSDQMVTAKEREQEVERQKAMEMEQKFMDAKRQTELQQQLLKEQQLAHQQNIDKLQKKMQEDFEFVQKHYDEIIQSRLAEQKRLTSEELENEALSAETSAQNLQSDKMKQQKAGMCSIS